MQEGPGSGSSTQMLLYAYVNKYIWKDCYQASM